MEFSSLKPMPLDLAAICCFFDTPRAADGLNHRYFIGSPVKSDEALITRYATLARESLTGPDYVAVSRPAVQVSRGQEREGLELLVVAGIPMLSDAGKAQLRQFLEVLLDSLNDSPMPVEGAANGLVLPSQRIADMDRKVRAFLGSANNRPLGSTMSVSKKPQPELSRRSSRNRIPYLVTIVCLLAAGLVAWGLTHRKSSYSSSSHGNPSPLPSSDSIEPSSGPKDWDFLRKENSAWPELGRLTGLPERWNRDVATAEKWASNLLREADPLSLTAANIGRKPTDIQTNDKVKVLLNTVENLKSKHSNPDPKNVSLEWLKKMTSLNSTILNEFWSAITKNNKQPEDIFALKSCLSDWTQKLLIFVDEPANVSKNLLSPEDTTLLRNLNNEVSPKIQVVTNADLERFRLIEKFFQSEQFSSIVQKSDYGKDWRSRGWPERLEKLKSLSKDANLSEDETLNSPLHHFLKSLLTAINKVSSQ